MVFVFVLFALQRVEEIVADVSRASDAPTGRGSCWRSHYFLYVFLQKKVCVKVTAPVSADGVMIFSLSTTDECILLYR